MVGKEEEEASCYDQGRLGSGGRRSTSKAVTSKMACRRSTTNVRAFYLCATIKVQNDSYTIEVFKSSLIPLYEIFFA